MKLRINGETREIPDGTTVTGLLAMLGIDRTRVAVERNRDVVPKRDYDATRLEAEDALEIVTFVGGG